jgi:uncharacterized coiled-coil protein SlyX
VDQNFLEFWGNFLISVAKGQQQLEDLTNFLKGDFAKTQGLTDSFLKAYGLENLDDRHPDFQKIWQKSKQAYLNLLGVVPREDYVELAQRCEELKTKVADQEETIKNLRLLLEGKGLDYGAVTLKFQELIKEQTETVHDFFSGLAEIQKKDK